MRDLHSGWIVRAGSGPVPDDLRATLAEGVPAQVPGCIHTDLLAADLIDDPFLDENEATQTWIGRTDWVYSTTFSPPDDRSGSQHELVLEGLDTVATVRLNGQTLLRTANQHRSYRVPIGELLRPGENELEIAFTAPVNAILSRSLEHGSRPRPYPLPYETLRKAAYSFGWDWGPHTATSGIWRPIRIVSWTEARLEQVRLVATAVDDGGRVRAEVTVASSAPHRGVHVHLDVAGVSVSAPVGDDDSGRTTLELELDQVRRWWPVGYGEQVLYDARVTVTVEGEVSDAVEKRVGFRSLRWDTSPDVSGTPLALVVNDTPVYVKGVNWIPDDTFLTRVDAPRYRRRLEQALGAHVNLVRVWGGGIYEDDAFFDACDELGLLVWQDFPFACAAYPEEEPLRSEVVAEASENIVRLAHHASLAMLCGNNENLLGEQDWGWRLTLDGRTWGRWYYYELLPGLVAELADHVPYSPGSPFSPGGEHPNDERHGSTHLWEQWNSLDWRSYAERHPRFVAEFGWQGPPAWATLTRAISDDPLTPESPGMIAHQKAEAGNAKLTDGLVRHFRVPTHVADWHWAMQLNQALAVRFALDHFRALAPLNTGAIVWQLNDCWPVTSWAAVDADERLKPMWYALRAAFAPRVATFSRRGERMVLVLGNDSDEEWTGTLTMVRRSLTDGSACRQQHESEVVVPARGSRTVPVPTHLDPGAGAEAEVLVAELGQVRGFWWFAEPRDSALPAARLTVRTRRTSDRETEVLVTAETVVRDLTLLADVADPSACTEQGMVTLLPGESVTFRVRHQPGADSRALATARVLRSANDLVVAPTQVTTQVEELIEV